MKMQHRKGLPLVLLSWWLVGCVTGGVPNQVNEGIREAVALDEEEWQVELRITGGVAGLDRMARVLSSGRLILENYRTRNAREKDASAAVMGFASNGVASMIKPAAQNQNLLQRRGCPDCMNYLLKIKTRDEIRELRLNTLTYVTSPHKSLVEALADELGQAFNR